MEKNIEDSKKLGKGHKIMEDCIKDAVIASNDEILLEAYDKEWALKDEGLRDGITQGIEQGITQGSLQKEDNIFGSKGDSSQRNCFSDFIRISC